MANEQNLIPFTSDQNREEAKKNGRKGGIASGEARRRRKAMREVFDEILSREYDAEDGGKVTAVEVMGMKVFQKAMDGDLRAVEFIRDTVGEKPVEKVESVEISSEAYERVAAFLSGSEAECEPGDTIEP